MKRTFRKLLPDFTIACLTAALVFGTGAWSLTGCKSASTTPTAEATTLTNTAASFVTGDQQMKTWATSYATRLNAAKAAGNAQAVATLATELQTVQAAQNTYNVQVTAAFGTLIAAKDAAGTNGVPAATDLAAFTASFQSANTQLKNVLSTFH